MKCALETFTSLRSDGLAMNLWSRVMMFGLCWMGCETPSQKESVLTKAQILEQLELTPLRVHELCGQIQEEGQQAFCIQYALQIIPKNEIVLIRDVCSSLIGNEKGECWFQVAETTLDVEDCEKSSPFVHECYGHITMRALQQSNVATWKEVEEIAKVHKLDFTHPIYGTMVYQYWFRNTSLLNYDDCRMMKEPTICRDAISMLYFQRLKEWDKDPHSKCDTIPDKLAHNNQQVLKVSFEKVYQDKCG